MNIAELEAKILSFCVNYTEKNRRLDNKKKLTEIDSIEYAYNQGFVTALSLVMQDLEKIDNSNEYKTDRR
jgi:hypothetical protein